MIFVYYLQIPNFQYVKIKLKIERDVLLLPGTVNFISLIKMILHLYGLQVQAELTQLLFHPMEII